MCNKASSCQLMIRGWRWGHLLFELSACQMCCCPVESLSMCVQCSRCGSYASHMEACWATSEHGQGEIPARGCEPRQLVGRSHAIEKKAMIYIHKQTRLLIYITTKPELGENWGHRGTQGQNTSCTQIWKVHVSPSASSTMFPAE